LTLFEIACELALPNMPICHQSNTLFAIVACWQASRISV